MGELQPLELQCFGAPTARVDGHAASARVLWHKHLALLVYLALSPNRTRTRSHLLGVLWPEKSEQLARHSLNEALRSLRTELGATRLTSKGDALTLGSAALDVDALQFDALAEPDRQAAVELINGEFLEGFHVDDAPAFEEWATERRAHYGLRITNAILASGEDALAATRYADAIAAARRALVQHPYSGPAISLLMRAAAVSGDAEAALAAFQEFCARLSADTGERPTRDLSDLANVLRRGRWQLPRSASNQDRPLLVGREKLHRTVFTVVAEGLRQGPRTLLISGDPGSGKTRLLRECLDRVTLDRGTIALTRPLDSDQDVRWSNLRALLLAGLLKAPGSAACDPPSLDTLSRIVQNTMAGDVAQVSAALGSLLRALAEEHPVAIGMCDAQHSDGPSLDVLGAATAQLTRTPLVVVLTTSPTWDRVPAELLRLRAELGRSLAGVEVVLEPLTQAETQQLVMQRSSWCTNDAERERLARRVFLETKGNPFLVTTLLRSLADASSFRTEVLTWPPAGSTDESPLPISVPRLAGRAITAQIARLEPQSRRVLQVAALGSAAIDLELVAGMSGLTPEAVGDALVSLERARLVTFEGGRYVFAAPLIAQVVLAEWLLPGERHLLRDHAIATLQPRTDAQSRLLRLQMMALDRPGQETFDEIIRFVQDSLAAGSRHNARRALAAAEQAIPPGDTAREEALVSLTNRLQQIGT